MKRVTDSGATDDMDGDRPAAAAWAFLKRRLRPIGLAVAALALILAIALAARLGVGGEDVTRSAPCVGAACRTAAAQTVAALPALPTDIDLRERTPENLDEMAQARAANAAVPFASGRVPAAVAFGSGGSKEDRARATTCLTTAMLYEAGADPNGQRAVAQVVLNRVRHPAYPASVCGVVYQGSDRTTGCQFTFTCDGSLRRPLPPTLLDAARKRAVEALDGRVFRPVGWATHYHTDWVHPVWSDSLDKVARIGTHLFLRWSGWWGTRPAFRQRYRGGEAPPEALARQSLVTGPAEPVADASPLITRPAAPAGPRAPIERTANAVRVADKSPPAGVAPAALKGQRLVLVHPDGGAYGLLLSPGVKAEALVGVATRLCGAQSFCHVMGWRDGSAVPAGFPVPPSSRAALAFSYRRDRGRGVEELRFDCTILPRTDPTQCL